MPWAKLDDQFDVNRKIRRAWREPRAIGLYVMAMTYASRHLTDGFVDIEWIEEQIPQRRERDRVIDKLVELGLWHEFGDGYAIHDFLEFNPSADKVEEIREARRRAGQAGGKQRASNVLANDAANPRPFAGRDLEQNPTPYPVSRNPLPKEPQGLSLETSLKRVVGGSSRVRLGGDAA